MDDKRDDGIVNSCYIVRKLPTRSGFPTARHRKFFGAFFMPTLAYVKKLLYLCTEF